jgi:membrane protein implicated in regulation of membrane protease activity
MNVQQAPDFGPAGSAPPGQEVEPQSSKRRDEVPGTLALALVPCLLLVIWVVLSVNGKDLESQDKFLDVISKVVTISATIVAAIWSYYAFFRQRLKEPRLNVSHEVHALDLPDGRRLLKVYASLTNVGQVRVEPLIWRLRADQILPLTKTPTTDLGKLAFTDAHGHAHWNCLAEGNFSGDAFKMALEPGETDRASANLVLPSGVEVVQIYSHFKCTRDAERRDGWPSKTLFDLRKKSDTGKGEPHEQTGF